jgi:iron-sulfur cluster repair protein YtfE (RIC family)
MTATQPLRDEHRELLPQVEALRAAADAVGHASLEVVRPGVEAAHEFLRHHLIPHAEAEERALYPVVDRLLGAPGATATMSRDHVEVGALAGELARLRASLAAGPLPDPEVRELRRVLYGLYALLKVHFAKEEEVYLPLLDDRLTPAAAAEMFAAMERAAGEARARQRTGA